MMIAPPAQPARYRFASCVRRARQRPENALNKALQTNPTIASRPRSNLAAASAAPRTAERVLRETQGKILMIALMLVLALQQARGSHGDRAGTLIDGTGARTDQERRRAIQATASRPVGTNVQVPAGATVIDLSARRCCRASSMRTYTSRSARSAM